MFNDALLAITHHLAVFLLASVLVAELALLSATVNAALVRLLGKLDLVYGLSAMAIGALGTARVVWGVKGAGFYTGSLFFWAKIAAFAAVGLISIAPTIRFLRWNKAIATDPAALPSDADVASTRRLVAIEVGLLFVIPIFAALMARGLAL